MGYVTDKSADVYRDFKIAGVPASGHNEPYKPDIRGLFSFLDGALATLLAGFVADQAVVIYAARSSLYDNLAPADRTLGLVYNDGANNGLYIKNGAAGGGSWNQTGLMLEGQKGDIGETGPAGKSFLQTAIDSGYVPAGTTEAEFVAKLGGAITEAATLRAESAAANAAVNVATMSAAPAIAAPLYDTNFSSLPAIFKTYMDQQGTIGSIYDPSVRTTVWKDVAATQPAVVGDDVFRIDDLSGQGRYLRNFDGVKIGTLRRDVNGQIYLDCPTGTMALHSYFSGRVKMGSSFYMAWAGAQMQRTGTLALASFAVDGGNGVFVESLNNGERVTVRFSGAGVGAAIQTPQGAAPMGVPVTVDVQLTPNLMSSWLNGSTRSVPTLQFDGGLRVKPTGTSADYETADAGFGLNWQGDGSGGSTMASRFYGGIWINGAVDGAMRRAINSWMRWRTGQLALDSLVYDTFIAAPNQSNGQGVGQVDQSPIPLMGQGAYWTDFGYIAQMADPVRSLDANVALTGSAWPRFAQRWYERTGNPCMIISAAASGCGIYIAGPDGAWGTGGGLVEKAAKKVREAIAAIGPRLRIKGLIGGGGEQDVDALLAGSVTVPDYTAAIVDIRNRLRAQIGIADLPLFLISADRSSDASKDVGFQRLRDAQIAAGSADAGMKLVVPYQDFTGQGLKTDGVHWNQTALNTVGLLAADSISDYFGVPSA